MANLRVHKRNDDYDKELEKQLLNDIRGIDEDIRLLESKRKDLEKDLLELRIKPFKVGEYVIAEVNSGRTKKEQTCLLECENGCLYLRPLKPDGELSGRHFSLFPVPGKTYSDYLRKL